MASLEDLTNSLVLDFAPQSPSSPLDDETPRAWTLQHPSPKQRTLTPITSLHKATRAPFSSYSNVDPTKPFFTMNNQKTGLRWTRRKNKSDEPGLVLSKTTNNGSRKTTTDIATANLNSNRNFCTITAPSGQVLQTIAHEKEPRSRYRCSADNNTQTLYWQTLGPSQTVLELVTSSPSSSTLSPFSSNETSSTSPPPPQNIIDEKNPYAVANNEPHTLEKRIALFVYTSDPAQQTDPESGRRRPLAPNEFGQLFITDWARDVGRELEGLVVSCLVVCEMRRMRRL